MKYLSSILSTLLLLSFQFTFAQAPDLYFKHLDESMGLSQSLATCLLKDAEGFVWAGTQDGLNQFNAYKFKTFYNDKQKKHSLSNNYILDLLLDKQGNVWIGTRGGGLCLYQPKLNRFSTYLPPASNRSNNPHLTVRALIELNSGELLIGTDAGLLKFDPSNGSFDALASLISGKSFDSPVYSLTKLTPNQYLVGSLETILLYQESKKSLKELKLDKKIEGGIHSFALESSNKIWAGTGKGLLQLNWIDNNTHLQLQKHYRAEDPIKNPISSNYIACLHIDQHHQLWIGTNDGLNYLNLKNQSIGFQVYKHDKQNEESISNNIIYDLIEVESGIMWAATQGGINQFKSEPAPFKKLDLSYASESSCASTVHGIVETSSELLACTEKGLLVFEVLNEVPYFKQCYTRKQFPQMEDEFLISISQGRGEYFWVALRRGGFAKLNKTEIGFEWISYKLPAGAYSNIGTNDLLEDESGFLWIASSGLGLWKLDLESGKYQSYAKTPDDTSSISGNYIFKIEEKQEEQLWVATADGGLCLFDKKTEKFTCFSNEVDKPSSLSNNMVLSIFEDSQERTWVGTADGLNLMQEGFSFKRFHQKDGLPNQIIYGMLEDEDGKIWLSTSRGIGRIEFQEEQFTSSNYFQTDGLLDNEFNQHAFIKLKNSNLVFGSKKGLSYFNPPEIKPYEVLPVLTLSSLKLFNEEVGVGVATKDSFYLNQAINYTQKVVLDYDQNFLEFEFTGVNFDQADLNQYAYQLEGLDPDWVYCGNRKFANYPGLKPGRYNFRFKAANHDGLWTTSPKSVQIIITPPPWKTWWAYLSYVLGLVLLTFSLFQYRVQNIRKIEAAKATERLLFRERSARDFHDEAGNQITKISLIAGIAKQKSEEIPDLKNLLNQLEDNVQALRSGMRDFIWVLDPEQDTLFDTLSRLKDFANEIFEFSPIHFTTSGIEEELKNISLNGNHRRHLLFIFKEVINNCLKYSNAKNAQFSVTQNQKEIILKFSDNGVGFNPEGKNSNYGLKNMRERAKKMGAVHKIVSDSTGTKVYLHLPKNHPNG